jgi:hypothetical protein
MALHPQPARWTAHRSDASPAPSESQGVRGLQPQQVPAIAAAAAPSKPCSTAAQPRWRRVVCSLLLAMSLATVTAVPAAPAFADEWCTAC